MRDHPLETILGDIKSGVSRRSQVSNFYGNFYGFTSFVSQIEPKTIKEAIIDEYCATKQNTLQQRPINRIKDNR
jgi:hypothetical protein